MTPSPLTPPPPPPPHKKTKNKNSKKQKTTKESDEPLGQFKKNMHVRQTLLQ